MTRVKRGVTKHKKRERLLKETKGFRWGRKSKKRATKEALLHARSHAFRGRKEKKRTFRELWNVQINAAARKEGLTYSTLMNLLKKNSIELNRKMLAHLAKDEPETFTKIVKALSSTPRR